jgi:hypothetical protein
MAVTVTKPEMKGGRERGQGAWWRRQAALLMLIKVADIYRRKRAVGKEESGGDGLGGGVGGVMT